MKITLRTKRFDTASPIREEAFYGRDFAEWLKGELRQWETEVAEEDWGWAIYARKGSYKYLIGIYDHNTNDVTEAGPQWCIRLFNRTKVLKRLFTRVPPAAHPEVVEEVAAVFRAHDGFTDIRIEPLD